jgi:cytochrome bd ubiquinol oxidase subunit I
MTLDLARWQFALTSVNHFFFVPVTIGLAFLTALLQTAWHRKGQPEYLRLTRFFGTLLVINVAVGVVTGLVREFEFGMNWSSSSCRWCSPTPPGPTTYSGSGSVPATSSHRG